MTAADYTPYLQGGRELGQQQGQNISGINGTGASLPLSEYLYSSNSLNITTQQPVEKGAQTPQQVDTPNSLKSSKTTQLGTPTAMTDLLAMLDDNTAFSDMVQQQEERQWDIDRHRNKFTTQLSSATTSGDTTTTTDLSPQVLMQQEMPMNMVSRSASVGLLEAVADKQTPLMPLQQQTEQQFINPNLLNNGGGVNSSLFVDDGFLEEQVGTCNGSGNQLIIDEVALSPDIQRRMSEVVTGSIPQQNHSRGSISHQIDFWNLSNDRQSISSGHSTSGRTANNSIDLMSFKKSPTPNIATAGTSITNTSATTLPTVTAGSTNTIPTTTNSSKSNSANNSNVPAPPSVFKIDNELTQLLNDYNIDFNAPAKPSHTPTTRLRASSYVPHTKTNTVTTSSSTGNILSSAAAVAAAAVATSATTAVPAVSTARRSNSVSEPQNRVQKQRTSVSLIDGNNPVIMDKLYGDVNNISKFSQWENAIISDDEDHEEKSTNRQPDSKVTLATATTGSKFISPAMLNQDLLENKPFEVRNTNTTSTNGISASTRRKRGSIPKGPRGTSSKSSSPLEEEEKPFKCQECTKAFRRSEHLKRHIRSVHSTDRPFPCTYCDKKFSRSDNLSQHLKTHRKHGDIKDILPAASLKKG